MNYAPADDALPGPAPGAPYGTTMSVFDGLSPQGDWRLYVADDNIGDGDGELVQWVPSFTTRPGAATSIAPAAADAAEGSFVNLTVTRAGVASLGPATVDVAAGGGQATAGADYTPPPSRLEFARGETTKVMTISLSADGAPEPRETFDVSLSSPQNDARLAGTTQATVGIDGHLPASGAPTGGGSQAGAALSLARCTSRANGNVACPVENTGSAAAAGSLALATAGRINPNLLSRASQRRRRRARRVTLARRAFTLRARERRTIVLRPSRRNKRLIRRLKRVRVKLTATVGTGAARKASSRTFTLRAPKPKRRR